MKFLMYALQTVRGVYLGKYSVVANTVTAGTLGFVGDLVAQKSEQKTPSFKWDLKRSRNMFLVCTLAGPAMHYWYKFLDRRFPGNSLCIVTTKVLIDLLAGPLWYGYYIGGISKLRGDTNAQTIQEFKDKIPIVIAVDLALWPIFQGFNFALFPPHYRILVLKCNELVFDVIFSHVANNAYTFSSLVKAIQNKLGDNR